MTSRRVTRESIASRAVITVEEAAELLTLSRSAAYRAVDAGQIPHVRLGRKILIPVPALLDLLEHGVHASA